MTVPSVPAADTGLASFAASLELSAVAAYTKAAVGLSGVVLTVAKAFASHHQDHANAWTAVAGPRVVAAPNAKLLALFDSSLDAAKTEDDVVAFAYLLENRLAATYQFALETLTTSQGLQVSGSILPVESEHAVVLGTFLGRGLRDVIPVGFQSHDGYLDPTQYLVG